MLLGTLGASLLGNILAVKGINRAGEGAKKPTRQGRGIVRASYDHNSLNSSKEKKGQKNSKVDF